MSPLFQQEPYKHINTQSEGSPDGIGCQGTLLGLLARTPVELGARGSVARLG